MPGILGPIIGKQTIIEYAQGAAQKAIAPVADFIAPTVNVAGLAGFYSRYSEKSRFRIPKTRRAPRQRATEVALSGELVEYSLEPHALDFPVDNLDKLSADGLENTVMEAADELAEIGALAHEKTVVDAALAAAGAGTGKTWGATGDPVKDIDTAILSVLKAAKYGSAMGVRILFGATAWMIFKNSTKVAGKFIAGASGAKGGGGVGFAVPTLENAGTLFLGNPEIRQSFMVYDDAPEGKDMDIKFILDTSILIFAAKPSPSRHDPSFMKTLRPRGQWMVPGTYLRDDGRVEVAKMDWFEKVITANEEAVERLVISDS